MIDTGHTTVRKLAKRFDLPLNNLLAAQPNRSDDIYHFFGGYYPKSRADQDFLVVSDRIASDADAAGFPTTFDSNTPAGRALDRMSVHEYIERRIPGGHRSPLGALLDAAYVIEYGADSMEQSALNLIFLLGYQPQKRSLSVFGESDEKFHIRGGNQQLPERMAGYLGGDRVRMGQRLARVKETASGRYKVTFERASGASDVVADFVVLALPFAVLNEVDLSEAGFDGLKHQAIAQQGRGRNGKLHLQFAERDWLGAGPWPGISNGSSYADTGYQVGWEATRAQGGQPGILVFYSGGSVDGHCVDRSGIRDRKERGSASGRGRRAVSNRVGVSRPLVERKGDAVPSAQESAVQFVVLLLQDRSVHHLWRLRKRTPGRRAVLRRTHVDRLPGVHGRGGVRGAACRPASGENDGARLTHAAFKDVEGRVRLHAASRAARSFADGCSLV